MIDKETQDQAWACAPKAFREGVIDKWEDTDSGSYAESIFEDLFGEHNLLSGSLLPDEVLMVPRKTVQNMYAANEQIKADFPNSDAAHASDHINHVLDHLFGTKCLPDDTKDGAKGLEQGLEQTSVQVEKSKAEPKFKRGDKVIGQGGAQESAGGRRMGRQRQ